MLSCVAIQAISEIFGGCLETQNAKCLILFVALILNAVLKTLLRSTVGKGIQSNGYRWYG